MSEFGVRPCVKADLASVLAVEKSVYGVNSFNHYFFRQSMDLYPSLFLVACDAKGEVCAYVLGAIGEDPTTVWVLSLAVKLTHRKRGIGKILTKKLLEAFNNEGVDHALLTVDPKNESAIRLYSNFGFVEVDREADYFAPGQERMVMRLTMAEMPDL
jgi:ribosomal protein S18 acetylase RimI-like enzyme